MIFLNLTSRTIAREPSSSSGMLSQRHRSDGCKRLRTCLSDQHNACNAAFRTGTLFTSIFAASSPSAAISPPIRSAGTFRLRLFFDIFRNACYNSYATIKSSRRRLVRRLFARRCTMLHSTGQRHVIGPHGIKFRVRGRAWSRERRGKYVRRSQPRPAMHMSNAAAAKGARR